MKVTPTELPEVLLLEPDVYGDDRGFFFESFRASQYAEFGIDASFVQDNCSRSQRGVLRGLHYQRQYPQGKLIQVVRGQVFDVAVDIRPESPTFRKWVSILLDDKAHQQLYIPAGYAHGFCVLSEWADFSYKCTDYYHADDESGVRWDDPELGIDWPLEPNQVLLSAKDAAWPMLSEELS